MVRVQDSALSPNEDSNNVVLIEAPVVDMTAPVWQDTTGIQTVAGGDNRVIVTWNYAKDNLNPPVEYNIYYKQGTISEDPFTGGLISMQVAASTTGGSAPSYSYTITDLANSTSYVLGVRAQDSEVVPNEDINTEKLAATPSNDVTDPTWISTVGVQHAGPRDQAMSLSWNSATDVNLPIHYNVYYDTTTPVVPGVCVALTHVTTRSAVNFDHYYEVTGLLNDLQYYFMVRAQDDSLNDIVGETITSSFTGVDFFGSLAYENVKPGSVEISYNVTGPNTAYDDSQGNLYGPDIISGTVNYPTGALEIHFDSSHTGAITGNYIYMREEDNNVTRSEERRVGKECRSRWSPYH